MQIASAMANQIPPQSQGIAEPGAPVAKDAIDPELIKLKRARPKIGLVTAAGLVFLCGLFLVRLSPDRRFAGSDAIPQRVTVADVLGGTAPLDRYVKLEGAEPLFSHAIRATTAKGSLGVRVVPVRGSGERLWLAVSGDGWESPTGGAYSGRLRKLGDLPFAPAVLAYATNHPRPVFATGAAVKAGLATGKVQVITGSPPLGGNSANANESLAVADSDKVELEVTDSTSSIVVGTLGDKIPSADAWAKTLADAGIAVTGPPTTSTQTVRFTVAAPADEIKPKLEAKQLWAARVEPVTKQEVSKWSAVRDGSALVIDGKPVPLEQVDLVGIYVVQAIPGDAYALLAEERPADYWYVLPITIVLALIGLVFAWALVRAVKRDLLPPRPTTT